MVKAVLFDIDGVLLDSLESNAHFFNELMMTAGYSSISVDEYAKAFHLTLQDTIKHFIKSDDPKEFERIYNLVQTQTVRYPVDLVKMPSDAVATITALHDLYKLGLVTSRVKAGVDGIPQLENLKKMMAVTVAYEDTVSHKPHPEPLLFAAQHLHLEPQNCVYVGDAATDLKAAQAAGMKCIIFGHPEIEGADGYVSSLSELPSLLSQSPFSD